MENEELCDGALSSHRTVKKRSLALTLVIAAALCVALGSFSTAFAAGTTSIGGDGADWQVPTNATTNTIWKDADGNVVPEGTEGATQYKVLTVWAEAWSTSGADYLGISNSAFFGNGGNGNALITTYEAAAKTTSVGVWATSANESPNAYNWNAFYNLYVATDEGIAAGAEASDWASISSGNVSTGTSSWSTEAGVWCGFKFRPDVVVTNNNLSEDQANASIEDIHNLHYSADGISSGGSSGGGGGGGGGGSSTMTADPDNYDDSYYIWGDENYNPQIMGYNNNSPYSFVASAFQLAELGEAVNVDTADYPGYGDEALDWKTVNMLPRSNRYTETPTECAVNIERLAKGSVYYTLEQINAGNIDKKKVAYVAYPWNRSGSPSTTDSQVVVAEYDYTENIGTGPMDGRTSWTSLAVDQLGHADDLEVATARTGGSSVNSTDESTTTYTLYYATADDLAQCDVIYCGGNTSTDVETFQEWIVANATSTANQQRASQIDYLVSWPCVTNGSNYTFEKLIYGTLGMDFIYPELFPSMQLSCYWCDNIYHLTDSILTSAMSWIYSPSSLPTGTELGNIPAQYNKDSVIAKLDAGLGYFDYCVTERDADGNPVSSSDETLNRVMHNIGIDGSTEYAEGSPYVFNGITPTNYWQDATAYFTDVQNSDDWYYDAVYGMAATGFITGYYDPDGNLIFDHAGLMDRAQLATILWRMAGEPEVDSTDRPFTDCDYDDYYGDAVVWAYEAGVITGYDDAEGNLIFDPSGKLDFEALAEMCARSAIGLDATDEYPQWTLNSGKYVDADKISDWARGGMAWAVDNGLITGGENGDGTYTLDPGDQTARGRGVTVLYRGYENGLLGNND